MNTQFLAKLLIGFENGLGR